MEYQHKKSKGGGRADQKRRETERPEKNPKLWSQHGFYLRTKTQIHAQMETTNDALPKP